MQTFEYLCPNCGALEAEAVTDAKIEVGHWNGLKQYAKVKQCPICNRTCKKI